VVRRNIASVHLLPRPRSIERSQRFRRRGGASIIPSLDDDVMMVLKLVTIDELQDSGLVVHSK
jgi:hypothetical protein